MNDHYEIFEDVSNPLDSIEEIMSANDWKFSRMNEDELSVILTGKMGTYNLSFFWDEDFSAMRFACEYSDLSISKEGLKAFAKIACSVNSKLWAGHFDICEDTHTPRFRHTSLFRGMTYSSGADHVHDLVDIALCECERYYPVFHLLSQNTIQDNNALNLAVMDYAGES